LLTFLSVSATTFYKKILLQVHEKKLTSKTSRIRHNIRTLSFNILPVALDTITATYADTAILVAHKDHIEASQCLQESLFHIQIWLKKWRIRVNGAKSTDDFHHLQKDMPNSNLEWPEDPSSREREIFGTTSRSQTKLEKTHIHQAKTT